MDIRLSDAVVVKDITDQNDPPKQRRDAANPSAQVDIGSLLANTSSKQSEIHETLSRVTASLTAPDHVPDERTSKQIWEWIFDNVFGTRFLNDNRTSGKIDNSSIDYEIALRILLRLHEHDDSLPEGLSPIQISSLVICSTDTADKNVSLAADELLSPLLQKKSISRSNNHPKLTTTLLANVVRPAFAQSRSKNITTAGRRAIDPLPQALTASEDERLLKPWKFSQRYVIRLLKWVLEHSDTKTIEENWSLIMPPVLSIIDDEATDSKIDGCSLLQILLDKVPAEMWTRTGLGKVFEDALNPVLAYVPPLVEQDEAERLIASIYPTLLSLCHCQFPNPDQRVKRMAMLDNLMRAGILSGLSYSGENIRISILLLGQMCVILSQMQICCVKHLKAIVPTLVGYLCDPFAFAGPILVRSVLTTTKCLITNAWPRMDRYSGELFKGIATCWQRSSEEPISESISDIRRDLKLTLQLLMKALQGNGTAKEIELLLQKDEGLADLLP